MLLIIGCGNILLGDEGVGVHLVEMLKKETIPSSLRVMDGGTGGLELIPFIKEAQKVIIVDSLRAGGTPGDIYKFTPQDYEEEESRGGSFSLHEIALRDVFLTMEQLGIQREIVIFGVEPDIVEVKLGLSPKLQHTLTRLKEMVLEEAGARTGNM